LQKLTFRKCCPCRLYGGLGEVQPRDRGAGGGESLGIVAESTSDVERLGSRLQTFDAETPQHPVHTTLRLDEIVNRVRAPHLAGVAGTILTVIEVLDTLLGH